MARKQDTDQYTEESFISPTGVHITVRRPILTPEERKRREDRVKQAMCTLYEECCKQGIPWPGDPGYDEYKAELDRKRQEQTKRPRRKKSTKAV